MSATPNNTTGPLKTVNPLRTDWDWLCDEFSEFCGDPHSTVVYGLPESLIDALERESARILHQ